MPSCATSRSSRWVAGRPSRAVARKRSIPASQARSIASRRGGAPVESSQRTSVTTARAMCRARPGRRRASSSSRGAGSLGVERVAIAPMVARPGTAGGRAAADDASVRAVPPARGAGPAGTGRPPVPSAELVPEGEGSVLDATAGGERSPAGEAGQLSRPGAVHHLQGGVHRVPLEGPGVPQHERPLPAPQAPGDLFEPEERSPPAVEVDIRYSRTPVPSTPPWKALTTLARVSRGPPSTELKAASSQPLVLNVPVVSCMAPPSIRASVRGGWLARRRRPIAAPAVAAPGPCLARPGAGVPARGHHPHPAAGRRPPASPGLPGRGHLGPGRRLPAGQGRQAPAPAPGRRRGPGRNPGSPHRGRRGRGRAGGRRSRRPRQARPGPARPPGRQGGGATPQHGGAPAAPARPRRPSGPGHAGAGLSALGTTPLRLPRPFRARLGAPSRAVPAGAGGGPLVPGGPRPRAGGLAQLSGGPALPAGPRRPPVPAGGSTGRRAPGGRRYGCGPLCGEGPPPPPGGAGGGDPDRAPHRRPRHPRGRRVDRGGAGGRQRGRSGLLPGLAPSPRRGPRPTGGAGGARSARGPPRGRERPDPAHVRHRPGPGRTVTSAGGGPRPATTASARRPGGRRTPAGTAHRGDIQPTAPGRPLRGPRRQVRGTGVITPPDGGDAGGKEHRPRPPSGSAVPAQLAADRGYSSWYRTQAVGSGSPSSLRPLGTRSRYW